jgi:hypothetical protein
VQLVGYVGIGVQESFIRKAMKILVVISYWKYYVFLSLRHSIDVITGIILMYIDLCADTLLFYVVKQLSFDICKVDDI